MLNERRADVRQNVNRPAKFQESPTALIRDCTIREISGKGVRLVIPGGLASDKFTLFDSGAFRRRCMVIWRLGEVVGARFEK